MLFCEFSLHPFVGRALLLSGRVLLLGASFALLGKVVYNSITIGP